MTFHGTVAVNRSYDLAFSGTNPQRLRLMMPHGSGETRVAELTRGEAVNACIVHLLTCGIHLSLFMHTRIHAARLVVSIFYSNPEKLEVLWNGRLVPPLEAHMTSANSYNFSMRKPAVSDPCGSNAFAGWENKVYVVVCGGTQGVEIVQVKKIVLSIGIELAVEDFFDPHCPGGQKWPKRRASGAPHSNAASAVRPPKLQQPNNAGRLRTQPVPRMTVTCGGITFATFATQALPGAQSRIALRHPCQPHARAQDRSRLDSTSPPGGRQRWRDGHRRRDSGGGCVQRG